MDLNEFERKRKCLDKYRYLLELNDSDKSILNSLINIYKRNNVFEMKEFLYIPEEVSEFKRVLSLNNTDYKEIRNIETIKSIAELVQRELDRIQEDITSLRSTVNEKELFNLDITKKRLENKRLESKENITRYKNSKNEDVLDLLMEKYSMFEKAKKKGLDTLELKYQIKLLERKLISDIEDVINLMCFKYGIDYKNKDIHQKHYEIINIIEKKQSAYELIKEKLKHAYYGFYELDSKAFNLIGKYIGLTDLKEISDIGLDDLLKDLKAYDLAMRERMTEQNMRPFIK